MAKLLTTKGISFFLDELFKTSKEFVYIVSPYLKINKQLEERINEALDNGLKIIFIYGKDKNQINQIKFLERIELYFYENLHAKFYINEDSLLITSMNLHSYSEANNREIGVAFSKESNDKGDLLIIRDSLKEFESIKKQSEKVNHIGKLQNNKDNKSALRFINSDNTYLNKDTNQGITKDNCNLPQYTFEQQIYKQLLKEYRKNILLDYHSNFSDEEIDNFVIALKEGPTGIKKVIASNKKFKLMQSELLERISRINKFEIVKILEIRKNKNDFKGTEVLIENLKTKEKGWYLSKKTITIVGNIVAVQLNEGFFNKYIIITT